MVWVLVGRIRTHSRATPLGGCFHQCKHWWIPLFSPPAKMQIESVLPHQKRVIHRQLIHMRQAPLSPLAKGGWFCLWQNRGDSIGLQVSTLVCAFGKVSHCESLSHGYAVPAPFGKGAFGVRCGGRGCSRLLIFQQMPPAKMQIESVLSHQKRVIHRQPIHTQQAPISPPCQRGVVLPLAKPGGFHRLTGFHIGLCFRESLPL